VIALPKDKATLIAGTACVAVLAGGWFALVSPALSQADETRTETQGVEASSESMRHQIPLLQAQLADITPRVQGLRDLGRKVTPTVDQPGLLDQLQSIASSAGVSSISNLTVGLPGLIDSPTPSTDRPVPAPDSTNLPGADASDEPTSVPTPGPAQPSVLASYEVSMTVTGSQPAVRQFVAGLQDGERLALVTRSDLSVDGDGNAKMQVRATMFLQQVDIEGLASQIEDLAAAGEAAQPSTDGQTPAPESTDDPATAPEPAQTTSPSAFG